VSRIEVEYRRPWLYPKQKEAIFDPARYSVVEASTKSGKTAGCLVWLLEQALSGRPGWNYWWIAPTYAQAKIAFRRMKRAITPAGFYRANDSELTVTLTGGTVVWFKTGDNPDALYGEDVHAAVVDEASRVKEEAWHALRSTVTATRGPVRLIGNVKGRKTWFYRMARKAAAREPEMSYHQLTWRDAVAAGILSEHEIEDARRQLPEAVFRELYEAEPSDDEGNPFGLDAIRACIAPLSDAAPAVWGWDLAKSVDWTVGIALDAHGNVCRLFRFQAPWRETKGRIVAETGTARALVDSTGVGDPVLEDLQRGAGGWTSGSTPHGRGSPPEALARRRNFEGFRFTGPSKQQLMEGLAVAIQQQAVRFPEGVIVSELESFEYEYTRTGVQYTAPEGLHDDCVCALALAVRARSERRPEPRATWI
jgi:hypothetical protein